MIFFIIFRKWCIINNYPFYLIFWILNFIQAIVAFLAASNWIDIKGLKITEGVLLFFLILNGLLLAWRLYVLIICTTKPSSNRNVCDEGFFLEVVITLMTFVAVVISVILYTAARSLRKKKEKFEEGRGRAGGDESEELLQSSATNYDASYRRLDHRGNTPSTDVTIF